MEFFHVFNRGVDKRVVYNDKQDYARFQRSIYILNTADSCAHTEESLSARARKPQTNPLVHIHAFALMPNHYHLLLSPVVEDGLSMFMKKINMGYSKYFNERNMRSGALWQGKYKAVLCERNNYFNYLPYYIHLNPLDLTHPNWRKGNVTNFSQAINVLNNYPWSSHCHFIQPKLLNHSPVVNSFFRKKFSNESKYYAEIKKVISDESISTFSNAIEY